MARTSSSGSVSPGPLGQHRALRTFGVTTAARGTSCVGRASWASSSSSLAPVSEIITGSSTTGASADQVERLADRLDGRDAAEHADLDGVDPDVVNHRPDLLDDHVARNGCTAVTATVF